MRGASALDELLDAFPRARIRAHVVWEPVLATDFAPPMSSVLKLVDDPRAVQYWDPDRIVSEDIVRAVSEHPQRYGFDEPLPPGFVVWDVVALFDGAARWEHDLPAPLRYGGPVVDVIEETRSAMQRALERR
ncbi:MAG TPA: hypothetical protein VJV23_07660 [Candidatus Polarisedimenticolia bacterium]|nr:hypothetical protein [Candidatus Polarisedimenticolia bacterium]